jgi:hypothetical protein
MLNGSEHAQQAKAEIAAIVFSSIHRILKHHCRGHMPEAGPMMVIHNFATSACALVDLQADEV